MTKIDYIRQKARIMSQTLEDLLPGYDCDEGRNPIAACAPLPAEAEVIRVVKLIDSAFSPGYREERASAGCTVDTHVTGRLDESYDILCPQVPRPRPFRSASRHASPTPSELTDAHELEETPGDT